MTTANLQDRMLRPASQLVQESWIASFGESSPSRIDEIAFPNVDGSYTAAMGGERNRTLRLVGDSGSLPSTGAAAAACRAIFDGVLYNRNELQGELGNPSGDISDAELILRAYLHWGEDFLHRIKGIFALIIHDSRTDTLLCVRDPLGIYPLFYARTDRELLLSTSIEALVRHPQIPATLNRAALADHLAHQWPDIEETYFANIFRVPSGHAMRLHNGNRQVYRYWNPAPPGKPVDWIREDEVERFDQVLDQAINRYLSLGPAGIYLSGGLDSVSVAAVAAKSSRDRGLPAPWALSLEFPADDINEAAVQRQVASDLELSQLLIPFWDAVGERGLILSALEVSRAYPAPLLNTWLPAYLHLGLEGRTRGCRVILTGSGGDEWLGVTPLLAADLMRGLDVHGLYQLWKNMQRSYPLPQLAMLRNLLWTSGVRPLVAGAAERVAPRAMHARRLRHLKRSRPRWLAPESTLRRELDQRAEQSLNFDGEPQTEEFYLRELRRGLDHALPAVEKEEYFETGRRLGVRLLHPYLDADVVDLLYRIPPKLLNRGGRSKGLVRQSLARRFPQLGFERQKKMLAHSFFDSIVWKEGMPAWRSLGGTPALAELGIVEPTLLKREIEGILEERRMRHGFRIWEVLNLESWVRARL